MTHEECIALIRPGLAGAGGTWADLGAGSGAFTLALAAFLGAEARIYAVDRDARALRSLQREAAGRFPGVEVLCADFTRDLSFPLLDGILIANAVHFHDNACGLLSRAARWLRPGGRFIVVEYDLDRPNPWVPHPLPWSRFAAAAECAGLSGVRLLGTRPSRYHQRMYAAAADVTGGKSR